MTARFLKEQPSVRIAAYDGVLTVQICIRGKRMEDVFDTPDGRGAQVTYWEYDYNEFSTDLAEIDVSDVVAHPENYIGRNTA